MALVKNKACYLIIAGKGNTDKYQAIVKQLKITNNIIFTGLVDNIQNLISAVDIAVLPTFYDPASRFILEALALGKPVITTSFNGAADLFCPGKHGLVIPKPTDIHVLSQAIKSMADPDTIKTMCSAIKKDKLINRISINRVASELTDVYESILKKKGN
jgi:UDP-glucose:(heptosyl)LPS alpha-1,3-glucosyltransferase